MIVIFAQRTNSFTFRNFLQDWGKEVSSIVRIIPYCDVISEKELPRGVYIFADIELLSPLDLARACEVARQLRQAGMPILNEPGRAMKRYDLLKVLHQEGLNQFRAYWVDEVMKQGVTPKYPVFLRRANNHNGSISPILHSPLELQANLKRVLKEGARESELIVTEYCDVCEDDGVFRKYSAYLIGEEMLFRSLLFSKKWVTKWPDLLDNEKAQAEVDFLNLSPHPHEPALRQIFKLGNINYGRIDYGIKDGAIQTWEINTNPDILPTFSTVSIRLEAQLICSQKFCAILRRLDETAPSGPNIPLQLTPALRSQLKVGRLDQRIRPSLRERYSPALPIQRTIRSYRRLRRKIERRIGRVN